MKSLRNTALMPQKQFLNRVGLHALIAFVVLLLSLGAGVLGYHGFEGLGWLDAFANASLILSGMGPLAPLKTESGKIFIGFYAIFSGVVFLTTVGFFLTPIVHRILHRLHLESDAAGENED